MILLMHFWKAWTPRYVYLHNYLLFRGCVQYVSMDDQDPTAIFTRESRLPTAAGTLRLVIVWPGQWLRMNAVPVTDWLSQLFANHLPGDPRCDLVGGRTTTVIPVVTHKAVAEVSRGWDAEHCRAMHWRCWRRLDFCGLVFLWAGIFLFVDFLWRMILWIGAFVGWCFWGLAFFVNWCFFGSVPLPLMLASD